MANDQVLTGGNSFSAPSAGIGAVILNDDQAQKNEDDAIANANEAIKANQAKQAAALAATNKMMSLVNLKPDGARPQDILGAGGLTERMAQIQNSSMLVNKAFNGDLSHPMAQQAWQKNVVEPQQQYEASVAASKGLAKITTDAVKELNLNPTKYDAEASMQKIHTLQNTHLQNIGNIDDLDINSILVPKGEDLDQHMDTFFSHLDPKGQTTTVPIPTPQYGDPGKNYERKITQNISPEKAEYYVNHAREDETTRQLINRDWNKIKKNDPTAYTSYTDKYLAVPGTSKAEADYKGQTDWLRGKTLNHQYTMADEIQEKGAKESEKDARAAAHATQMKQADFNQGDAEIAANFANGRPGFDSALKQIKLDPYTTYETITKPDPYNSQATVEETVPKNHEDNVIEAKRMPDGTYSLLTSKMVQDATDAGQKYPDIKPMTFPTINAMYSYIANKGGGGGSNWMKQIDNYYVKRGAKKADGTWDTEKLVPSSTWKNTAPQPAAKPAATTNKTAVSGYRIGQTQGGYKYTGGDPTKPENWEKQ